MVDNCEHVIGACASVVDAVLRTCPKVVVVATSRESLGVPGEAVWRVPPLGLPGEPLGFESLSAYDGVRLFIERASTARPNFRVTSERARRRRDLCPVGWHPARHRTGRRSDAHARSRSHPRRPRRPFRLLTGGARTASARQQTLEASVGWSYALLTDEERCALRRLSVFAGGFTLDGAEQVCGGDGLDLSASWTSSVS